MSGWLRTDIMRLFQLPLSTVIVAQIVAAILLFANVRAHTVRVYAMSFYKDSNGQKHQDWADFEAHGWPFSQYVRPFPGREDLNWGSGTDGIQYFDYERRFPMVLGNVVIALLIIAIVTCFCEWTIRRRAECSAEMR